MYLIIVYNKYVFIDNHCSAISLLITYCVTLETIEFGNVIISILQYVQVGILYF